MALDTSAKVDFEAKRSNTTCFRSPTAAVTRTDVAASTSGSVVLTNNTTETINLNNTDISVLRVIYVESDGIVRINLLDNDAAVSEITDMDLAGASGTGSAKLFLELKGFTIAANDTFTINNTSGSDRVVTYFLGGDSS